jgi:predicted nucleic acid-binding protein
MAFVLDASVALRWHFEDEFSQTAQELSVRATREGIFVPTYWRFETANGLLRGMRERRTSLRNMALFLERLDELGPEECDFASSEVFENVLPLAMNLGLKMFDAGYLVLAKREGIALATFDRKLADAARIEGVAVLGLSGG